MQNIKKGAFTSSVDLNEISSGSGLFAILSTLLVTMDNIKSYMNQDLFHFIKGF